MGMRWSVVSAEHVRAACQQVAKSGSKSPSHGLVVVFEGQRLPAKQVAKVAYLLATQQPLDTPLRFASGETLLNLLRKHGCHVERIAAPATGGDGEGAR